MAQCSHQICYTDLVAAMDSAIPKLRETGACPEPNAHRELHGSGRSFVSSCLQEPGWFEAHGCFAASEALPAPQMSAEELQRPDKQDPTATASDPLLNDGCWDARAC